MAEFPGSTIIAGMRILGNPVWMRRIHAWLTLAWFVAAIPICLFMSNSVPFLVFISVYAVVTGHWSSWQAARVEVRQEEAEKKATRG